MFSLIKETLFNKIDEEKLKDIFDELFGSVDDILKLSLEQQSTYADQVCIDNVENTEFLRKQFKKPSILTRNNIGNLAYLALNSIEPYKTLAHNELVPYITEL